MSATVLREVRLYGELGRRFGRVFMLAVATPAEAVRALIAVLPGFQSAFVGRDGKQGYFVYVGRQNGRRAVGREGICEPLAKQEPIRFVPVIAGAKRNGTGTFILGLVLEAAGMVLTYYTGSDFGLINLGASLQLAGVIMFLSPQRKAKDPATNLPSYVFDGPVNNTEQGGPVPCCYGRAIVGSVVVSQGITTSDYVAPASAPIAPNDLKLPWYEPLDPFDDSIGRGG